MPVQYQIERQMSLQNDSRRTVVSCSDALGNRDKCLGFGIPIGFTRRLLITSDQASGVLNICHHIMDLI
jgi:hypothetical protein